MERASRRKPASLLIWVLASALLTQNLMISVISSASFEDRKNYNYSPDPTAGSPPIVLSPPPTVSYHSPPSYGTPTPTHATPQPSHGSGGSYGSTPSSHTTPSHGHHGHHGGGGTPPANCGNPPTFHDPSPAPPTPTGGSGGGYHYSPPSSGGSTPIVGNPPTHHDPSPAPPTPTGGSGGGYNYSPPSYGGSPPIITPTTPSTPPIIIPPTTPSITPPTIPSIDPGTPTPFDPNPPTIGGTCDFWKTHPGLIWGLFGWWGVTVGGAFGVAKDLGFGSHLSLMQALSNTRPDGIGALYREGTASLLNSMVNKSFPFSTKQVKDSFLIALGSNKAAAAQASIFKLANEGRLKPRV